MVGTRATKGLVLRAAGRLIADEVRIGTAETRRTRGLVGVDHDMMLGSLLHDIEVVVVHRLRVVMVATWDDVAYVAGLYGIVAVFVHQLESLFHVALVVLRRTGGLMVHQ